MPEINANIVVEPINLTIDSTDPAITITPEPINLNIYTGGIATPSGNIGDIAYNAGGVFGGIPTANYIAGNLSLGAVANLKISGGNNTFYLQTDGTGNLTWAPGTGNIVPGNSTAAGANTQIQMSDGAGGFVAGAGFTFDYASNIFTAPGLINGGGNLAVLNANLGNLATANYVTGTLTTASQPNITTVGNLTGLRTTSTNVTLGNLAGNSFQSGNSIAIGNNAGYVQQYDNAIAIGRQAGNSDQSTEAIAIGYQAGYADQGNAAIAIGYFAGKDDQGNSSIAIGYLAGGANLSGSGQEIQSVAIGASAGEKHQGANSVAIGFAAGRNEQHDNSIVLNASGANLDTLAANSFVVKPLRINATSNALYYNPTSGEISYDLITVPIISNGSSNVNIPSANGNITMSVAGNANVVIVTDTGINVAGTLNVTGNANVGNIGITGNANVGNIGVTGNITAGNANLGNLATANYFSGSGNLLSNIQAANINGTIANANYSLYAGTVLTNAQPNITSLGILTSLSVNSLGFTLGSGATGNTSLRAIAFGSDANATAANSIAIGHQATAPTVGSIAIGTNSGLGKSGNRYIAIGENAGQGGSGINTVAIGYSAANSSQGNSAIAIGSGAGDVSQGPFAIAIGSSTANSSQGNAAIAIGEGAARSSQGNRSIAIGRFAGFTSQGIDSIAIGTNAGYPNAQANNSIVLNATGANLDNTTANSFVVKPIRNASSGNVLYYNQSTGEVVYDSPAYGSFYSNATQTSNGANTTNYMTFNNTDINDDVSIQSNSQITIARTGKYDIQFSAQLEHDTNQTANVELWLVKNGTGVAETNTILTLTKDQRSIAAWNFLVNAANANDYFQLAWASSDTNVQLLAVPAGNTIANIAVPSVICTVTPVGA